MTLASMKKGWIDARFKTHVSIPTSCVEALALLLILTTAFSFVSGFITELSSVTEG